MDLKTYIDTESTKTGTDVINDWDYIVIQSFNTKPSEKTPTEAEKALAMCKINLGDFTKAYLKKSTAQGGAGLADSATVTEAIKDKTTMPAVEAKLESYRKTDATVAAGYVITDTTAGENLDQRLNDITNKFSSIETAATATSNRLTAEIARATTAETTLQTNITNEATRATGVETNLQAEIGTEERKTNSIKQRLNIIEGDDNTDGSIKQALKNAKDYTDSEVNTETTRATSAETTLQTNITNEATRATGVEAALQTEIGTEEHTGSIKSRLNTIENVGGTTESPIVGSIQAVIKKVDDLNLTNPEASVVTSETTTDSFVETISQTNGQLAATRVKFNTDVINNSASLVAPTTQSIVSYINSRTNLNLGASSSTSIDPEVNILLVEEAAPANKIFTIEGIDYYAYKIGDTYLINAQEGESKFTQKYQLGLTEEGHKMRAKGLVETVGENYRRWTYIGNIDAQYGDKQMAAINSGIDSGWMADTKAEITTETTRATTAETTLQTNIANEAARAKSIEGSVPTGKNLQSEITSETTRATTAENALDTRLDIIEGDEETTGSINKAFKDAKDYTDDKIAGLDSTIYTNLNAQKTGIGTAHNVGITISETDGKLSEVTLYESDIASAALLGNTSDTADKATAFGYIKKALADAKDYTDTQISDLSITKNQTPGADGLSLSITEEGGKIKSISGSIKSGTYDASGAADTALSDAKTYTDNKLTGYSKTDHTHSYLSLSGGELTGKLTAKEIDATGSKITASTFVAVSARDKKENILPFEQSALDIINNTDVVSFNYKNDPEKEYKVGFIADDTNEILATKNHDRMDINSCIGVLLKAVQELSDRNKELEERIKRLEK